MIVNTIIRKSYNPGVQLSKDDLFLYQLRLSKLYIKDVKKLMKSKKYKNRWRFNIINRIKYSSYIELLESEYGINSKDANLYDISLRVVNDIIYIGYHNKSIISNNRKIPLNLLARKVEYGVPNGRLLPSKLFTTSWNTFTRTESSNYLLALLISKGKRKLYKKED